MEQNELTELIERARQGKPDAQDTLVRMAQNRVYYHCKKMLKKEEDAQDATQDVLITMLTSLDKLREPAAFWGWVNGITANRCRHMLSTPHREWQIPEDDEGNSMLDDLEDLDKTLVPEQALDDAETRRMILDLVDALPPDQRLSVLFYYYDEMSVKDIAQAMEVSEGTVKSRLNYARKAIKKGVEDYERSGIKLYSVSPILLLVLFLRQDASTCTLDGAAAAAMAGQILAQTGTGAASEGAGAGAAATAAESAGVSAAGSTTVAGTAGMTAAGISTKVIAGVLAGILAVGGVAGAAVLMSRPAQEDPTPVAESVAPETEDGSFGALHGFTLVEPQPYGNLPLTTVAGDSSLVSLPSAGDLTEPVITVSGPDEEGYVTYTASYTVSAQARMGDAGGASLAFSILAQDYNLYDWYTGQLYFPDQRADSDGEARATGSAQIEYQGETIPITYEKRWTSGMSYGDWAPSDEAGLTREITVTATQDVTFSVRVPEGYDGVLLGVNVTDPADPEKVIQAEWDLETDDPTHYEFVRLSDWAEKAPVQTGGALPTQFPVIAAGGTTALIDAEGTLWLWGKDLVADSLINGTIAAEKAMEDVRTADFNFLSAAVVQKDGSLWMWGNNEHGQLGNGTTVGFDDPLKIMDDVAAVSCGTYTTAAIRTDGSLWTWGYNEFGQLGNGMTADSTIPVKIMDGITAIDCGAYHIAALREDGALWTWGNNNFGQLGNGTVANSSVPIQVMDDVVAVSCGTQHTAALKRDGTVWTWGFNEYGGLGNGTTVQSSVPIKVLDGVASISCGATYTAAVKTDGSLWMWGCNSVGQLGIGTTEDALVPIHVMDDVIHVAGSWVDTVVLKADGSVWGWGNNTFGQLLDGTTEPSLVPIPLPFSVRDDVGIITPSPGMPTA